MPILFKFEFDESLYKVKENAKQMWVERDGERLKKPSTREQRAYQREANKFFNPTKHKTSTTQK